MPHEHKTNLAQLVCVCIIELSGKIDINPSTLLPLPSVLAVM